MTLTLLAPIKGWVAPLDEAPDPVFAGRMLGDGVAIDPTDGFVHAPCDGQVVSVSPTGHAVTLRAGDGAEILIHIGLETVALGGEGFTPHVAAGETVKAGAVLIAFDLDRVARRARSLLTPVLVINTHAFALVWRRADREVEVGDPLIELRALNSAAAAQGAQRETLRRAVVLGLSHGLHARPAAKLAALAKGFASDLALVAHGRSADARSPIALMTLGAGVGDEVRLSATGSDAEAALSAVTDFLSGDGGEATSAPLAGTAPTAAPVQTHSGLLRGVPAAPGLAVGRAVQFRRAAIAVVEAGSGVEAERAVLAEARRRAGAGMRASANGDPVSAEILNAHLALLNDPTLLDAAARLIAEGKSAAFAWSHALDVQADALGGLNDARLKARVTDLLDIKRQVLLAIGGGQGAPVDLPADAVVLADDLTPSELMAIGGRILGLCTAGGGATSHAAIIAASMGLPMIAATGDEVLAVQNGRPVILDGDLGALNIAPSQSDLHAAKAAVQRRTAGRIAALAGAHDLCRTADGVRIEVFANLAAVVEAAPAITYGAEGCGLLRSEFLFMDRAAPPDEAEQHAAYQAVAAALGGRPLVIRTLDIGGDKPVAYLPLPKEENPALGLRGIRTSLWRPDLLRTQLRAILRVEPTGVCRIMLPMIASVDEVHAARQILDQERHLLGFQACPHLGVMIETPAAALTAAALAETADFLSIGVNDLTQYALAIDRAHPMLGAQLDALHPAVLRLIAMTCEGARLHRRPVAMCGALAAQPLAAPLLVGLGVTEFSVPPSTIPGVKAAIRPLRIAACRSLAGQALAQPSAAAVKALLETVQADGRVLERVR